MAVITVAREQPVTDQPVTDQPVTGQSVREGPGAQSETAMEQVVVETQSLTETMITTQETGAGHLVADAVVAVETEIQDLTGMMILMTQPGIGGSQPEADAMAVAEQVEAGETLMMSQMAVTMARTTRQVTGEAHRAVEEQEVGETPTRQHREVLVVLLAP
jgi:hypothetical protein